MEVKSEGEGHGGKMMGVVIIKGIGTDPGCLGILAVGKHAPLVPWILCLMRRRRARIGPAEV